MLPYVLAIAVGLTSLILFTTAFFLPDIHRKDDFFWSGVGLFYALVLWFCATRITGGVLLGQVAAVALLTSSYWQTFKLRNAIAKPEKQINLDSFSIVDFFKGLFSNLLKSKPKSTIPATEDTKATLTTAETNEPATEATEIEELESTVIETPPSTSTLAETETEPVSPETISSTEPENATSPQPGFFGKFFRKKQPLPDTPQAQAKSSLATTKLDEILDEEETAPTTETTSQEPSEELLTKVIATDSATEIATATENTTAQTTPAVEVEVIEDTEIEFPSEEITDSVTDQTTTTEDSTSKPTNYPEVVPETKEISAENPQIIEEKEVKEEKPLESSQAKPESQPKDDLNLDEFLQQIEQKPDKPQ